jgi:hypothetical protein
MSISSAAGSTARVMLRGGGRERETRLLAVCAVVLVPWIVVLAATLPAHTVARNWSMAWSGFDVLLAAMLGTTAWFLHRRDPRSAVFAGASAAMLMVDAWFDTCTSALGVESATAWFSALCIELPLAFVCARIALRRPS